MSKLILTVTLLTSAATCDPRPLIDLVEHHGGAVCAKLRYALSVEHIAPPLARLGK